MEKNSLDVLKEMTCKIKEATEALCKVKEESTPSEEIELEIEDMLAEGEPMDKILKYIKDNSYTDYDYLVYVAAYQGNNELAKFAIDNGGNPNVDRNDSPMNSGEPTTAKGWAIENKDNEMIELFK